MEAKKRARTYGAGRIFKHENSRFWYAAYNVNGVEFRKSTGLVYDKENLDDNSNERKALKVLADFVEAARQQVGKEAHGRSLKYEDLRELILRDYRTKGRKSLRSLEQSRLYNLDKGFAGVPIEKITTVAVDRYEEKRLEVAARATVNLELCALKRMFKLAAAKKLIGHGAGPTIAISDPDNARQGFVEPPEFALLTAALPAHLAPLIEWLYATSWRVGEARALTWSDIDFAEGLATIDAGRVKNKEGKMYPFAVNVLAAAAIAKAKAMQHPRTDRVFHTTDGRPIKTFRKAWATACEAAAEKILKKDPNATAIAAKLEKLIVHDLRRSAIRNAILSGVSEQTAMKISGHRTASIFRRYNVESPDRVREAAARAGNFVERKTASPLDPRQTEKHSESVSQADGASL
jgi:integrase